MPIVFTDPPGPEDLVNRDPLALFVAMILDQQVPIEWAFRGPARLATRLEALGHRFDARELSELEPDVLVTVAVEKPAVHRYPAAMARRIHGLCRYVTEHYGGDAGLLWREATDAGVVLDRLLALPGFGPEKAQITLAVLVKRFGHDLAGWQQACGPFADDVPRSVADIGSSSDLARLRSFRKEQKALGRPKTD
ncbi:MAG: Fe-S cluster assembly protein HesB [Actinomycetota bacterium]|nr:Fe-S cluster assembly protein HesB [Actinomycetota bacterium]